MLFADLLLGNLVSMDDIGDDFFKILLGLDEEIKVINQFKSRGKYKE